MLKLCLYVRPLLAIGLLTLGGSVAAMAQAGCGSGPYTSCTDQIPATFLSGSWIELNGDSEWTLTANNGSPGTSGTVTGTVLVFPPASSNPGNCPVINYTASGSYTPSSISSSEGSTSITWVATNPNPNTTCDGYTPVSKMTFTGTIANKGNDSGTATYTNSSGGSGPTSLETNLVQTPTGEALSLYTGFSPQGWGASPYYITQLQINQLLQDTRSYDSPDPHNDKFQGTQVYETANGTPNDACYTAAQKLGLTYPGGAYKIQGSVWNTGWQSGLGNTYGPDGVGWTTVGVSWYRSHLPSSAFPCTATIPQAMTIVNNISGYGNQQYATHTLYVTIGTNTVTVKKDSLQQTVSY